MKKFAFIISVVLLLSFFASCGTGGGYTIEEATAFDTEGASWETTGKIAVSEKISDNTFPETTKSQTMAQTTAQPEAHTVYTAPETEASSEETQQQKRYELPVAAENEAEITFVLNTNTKKFHLKDCSSVSDMFNKNRYNTSAGYADLIELGYKPCQRCLKDYQQ